MTSVRSILSDRLYLSAVGIVVVFLIAVAYLFAAVLDQPLTSRPVNVDVELEQTGGLFEGSAVTYRGIKVGKVTTIVPTDEGVLASIRINAGTDIPKDSLARVRSLSPVGEQYLDFQPDSPDGPFLESGDTVAAESTDLPESLSETVVAVNDVLRQIDDKKLRVVLRELSTALAGTGDDIGRILDQGTDLLATLDEVWPETDRVITNAGTVLRIVSDNEGSLRVLGNRAKQFAAFLRSYEPEWQQVLDRTPGQIEDLKALIRDAEDVLPGFLDTGVSFTDIAMAYEPHLRTLLREYAPGIGALASAIRNERINLHLIPVRTARCDYGTTRRDGFDPERHAFQTDGRCAASFARLQRGAAHAPGPVR
ncbi:MlaD family protein [Nocardioides bizhenqiangii]|uniref:MlaD family protein n=1 Tax=Nocardioides bizhenqiangii TaxID=3095076 RepID=A0ABZ0ZKI8_9ACTN|nr:MULTISPECIES: MlaD family protein [unclassified Nocardioides]MDZ5620499.1 MlaD family protein [Nocardioides sp. HM23]WQQ24867.1 MlaD family protein [Nocardioides sp. HM61]